MSSAFKTYLDFGVLHTKQYGPNKPLFAEVSGDNAYRSLNEFETLRLKQRDASKQSNILLKTDTYLAFYLLSFHHSLVALIL